MGGGAFGAFGAVNLPARTNTSSSRGGCFGKQPSPNIFLLAACLLLTHFKRLTAPALYFKYTVTGFSRLKRAGPRAVCPLSRHHDKELTKTSQRRSERSLPPLKAFVDNAVCDDQGY